MNNQFDLFGALGIEKEEPKKPEKKGTSKSPSAKGNTISLPCDVYYMPGEKITISFDGKETATVDEVISLALKDIPFLDFSMVDPAKCLKKDKSIYLRLKDSATIEKGSIELTEETKVFGPDYEQLEVTPGNCDIANLIEDTAKANPELASVNLAVAKSTDGKLVFVYIKSAKKTVTLEDGKAYEVHSLNGSSVKFEKNDKVDAMTSIAKALYPELDLQTYAFGAASIEENKLLMFQLYTYAGGSTPVTKAKEQTYSIDGVTLSLLFTEYELSADDFNGKNEVTQKEITAFLVSKGHREYSVAEYTLTEAKKDKLLIVTIKGSKKGAIEHPLFDTDDFGHVSLLTGIPKLPKAALRYFLDAANTALNKGELLLELFYEPRSERYLFFIPRQNRSSGSVQATFESFFESRKASKLIKVGEFHSHGSIPPFWSNTDNESERFIPGLYAVIGNLRICPEMKFRFSTGESFIDISSENFFREFVCEGDNFINSDTMLQQWINNVEDERKAYTVVSISESEYEIFSNIPSLEPYAHSICGTYFLQFPCHDDSSGLILNAISNVKEENTDE